ncbi:CHAT domain-containing protein [Micromonospora parva]|uniref:CHAT domain-containing protein n=1 Tax=Micromonospora parva TaxID=1464048 RepID=A0ABW6VQ27_9ACTN
MTRSSLTQRAKALWGEFQESGDPALLDEAVDLLRAVLPDARDSDERVSIMSNLAAVLQAASAITGDIGALQESIALLQEGLADAQRTSPVRNALVINLATGLRARYALTGDIDALLGGIRLLRFEANEHVDAESQATLQNMLGAMLLELYLAGGDLRELDEAVSAARLAVALTPAEEAQLPPRLTTLASALSARCEATQNMADLDTAIATARRALAFTAPWHRQVADLAANLGALLHSRFELTGLRADLDEAIALSSSAASAEHPRAATLRNLGSALLSRSELSGDMRDLDEAVALHDRAVNALPAESTVVGDYLADLGRCRTTRYRITGDPSDIQEAIAAMEEAVRRTPAGHPRVADYLFALAEAWYLRYSREADNTTATMAVDNWKRAASVVGAGTAVRLKAARSWAETAALLGDWTSAAEGYETTTGLLPELLWRGADQADRSSLHDELANVPCDSAACMIEVGRPARALELLEAGRVVLWRWLLGLPTEIDTLGRVAPDLRDLANALAEIRNEVNHTGVPVIHARRSDDTADTVDRRVALAREWDELVERVRSIPGLDDFLRSPRAERLLTASTSGPVVIINASRFRCDALVLRGGSISVVRLPELTHEDAVARLNEFLSVVSELRRPIAVSDSLRTERVLTDLLAWLWHTIATPVLEHLGLLPGVGNAVGPLSHIWWCPTGPLAILPLHAASFVGPDGSSRGLLDHAVSSYTATVSHLAREQSGAAEPATAMDERPLLVSLAATPGMPGLPSASREMEILSRSARQLRPTILTGGDATTTAVRELLTHRSWVHFSCHGAAEVDAPWHSGIQLYDRRLPLRDLAGQEGSARQMVILSSCATSAAGKSIADESLNLVAALQCMGARHVVGALWSVQDESAAVMTDHLYRGVSDSPAEAARLAAQHLRNAVIELRRAYPHVPSTWACFVHYGP